MNTLKKQFSDALKREGKTITTYYKSESVKCLFRKNNDNNNTDNHMTIFYDISAPINQGQLLSYGGKQYITLNKESIDNDTYYKSSLLECNMLFPMTINSVSINIPCYAYNLSSAKLLESNVITTLDGNGEIITEATDTMINIDVSGNKTLNIMGRWFKVINAYNINGISHVFTEITVKPADNFVLTLSAPSTSITAGDTSQITASCSNNGTVITGQTVTYSSSDTSIATVSSTGLVTSLKAGTVIITGTWTEQNKTAIVTYTVSAGASPSYIMTIASSGEFTLGTTRTLTPTLKDGNGNTISSWTAVWSFSYNGVVQSDVTISYVGNQCKVSVSDEAYDSIDGTLVCTCKTNDNLASATYTGTITA